jgi:nucleoid DNA-binding protein
MKLKECNEAIAKACDLTPKAVASVHAETFRLITEALEKGERVFVPEFGVFTVKDIEATGDQPAKKLVRFRQRGEEEKTEEGEATKDNADRKERKKRKAEAAAGAASEKAPAEAAE